MAKKKTAIKKKPTGKRGRGRPPGSKSKTKKLSTNKTENKGASKRGRPPKKKEGESETPTRSNKSFDQYYQPSSNTSVV